MTVPANNKARGWSDRLIVPVEQSLGAGFPINQGDMVWFDTAAFIAKALDTQAHAATFVGISEMTVPTASLGDLVPSAVVIRAGSFYLFTTAGDSYNPGDTLFLGADAQTVTKVAGTNAIGFVDPANYVALQTGGTFGVGQPVSGPFTSPFPIAGGAGIRILVIIKSVWPAVALNG